MQTIETMNQRLTEARTAYYAGDPIMTDGEYDALEQQLATMVKNNPEQAGSADVLTTVGTDTGGRIPHARPMRSIDNIYDVDELVAWAEKVDFAASEPVRYTLGPKWDGVSLSLTYEPSGDLVKAVTRGDGDAGESVLPQIMAVKSIPKKLRHPVPSGIEVRGEIIMSRSTMEALNAEIVLDGGKPYVSTRNLVAGTLKLKDAAEVTKRNLEFRPWEVVSDLLDVPESGGTSALDRLIHLQDFGFVSPEYEVWVESMAHLRELVSAGVARLSEKNPEYAQDGMVLKVDSCAMRRQLGVGSKFANFQVAFKAQNAREGSVLREVIWQVGRQGKLTPVGVIDPIVLASATIERVTLNNLTWIRSMGLKIGSRCEIVRSGDVIPQVVRVLDA